MPAMIKARIATADDRADRRKAARLPVAIDAKVREMGMEGAEAKIVNLSESGFMAETSESYDVGARVWLILPGRDRASAVVRWTAGDRLGAEFAEPISIDGIADDD